jgi:hypothetical protein
MSERNRRPTRPWLAAIGLLIGVSASGGAIAENLTVVRDAQTGQLRAPTAAESQAARAPASTARAPVGSPGMITGRLNPGVVKRADGVMQLELTEATMTHSVVTRAADGSLKRHCVTSQAMAQRLAKGELVSFAKNMSERAHDVK